MKLHFTIILVLINMLLTECENDIRPVERTASIKKDIPLYKNGKEIYAYKIIRETASKLNLDSLDVGFDSLQIRFWFGYAKCDSGQIFIIKNKSGRWSAESIIIKYLWNDSSLSSYMSDTISKVNYNTNRDWSRILKSLSDLQIMTLVDQHKITGYKDVGAADGSGCCVEIATKTDYRFYGYWEPLTYKAQYWQAKNMIDIIKVLEKEFQFYPLWNI